MAAPPLNFSININPGNTSGLQNILNQTAQFQKALTDVDQKSRGVFLTLEDLGQRYQQRGFMGRQDQQSLQRATQQWERMSQVLSLQRSQAAADLQRIRAAGVIGPADRRLEAQAQARFQGYEVQQRGMAELERSYAFQQLPQLVRPSGAFSPWAPPGQAPPPVPPQPGGGARGVGGGPPLRPGARGGGTEASDIGDLLRTLGAVFMVARDTPSGINEMASGGGGLGGLLGLGGGIGGLLKGGAGLAVGLSALQQLSQGMQAYETRHLGVLDVGRQLDEQYEQIGGTLTYLYKAYQVTGREGVAAMSAIGRVTGTVAAASKATVDAMRVGRAYGMSPEAAAQMQAQLIQYSPTGVVDPRVLVGAFAQAQGRGELQRMSFERFGEAAAAIAGTGGFGRMMVSREQAAEQTRMMAAFGGRYEANPAGAFQQYYERQYAPKSELGEVINWQAMADVMRANPQGIPYAGGTLNPQTSFVDQQILLQQGGTDIDAFRAAQFRRARSLAGGNRDQAIINYMQATNLNDYAQGRREYETLLAQEGTPEGITGRFRAPGAAQVGEAVVAGREARPWRRGQDIRDREMLPEALAETDVVKTLEDARTLMMDRMQKIAESFNYTNSAAEGLVKIFTDLTTEGGKLKTLIEDFQRLPLSLPAWVPDWARGNQIEWDPVQPQPRPPTEPLPTQPRKSP